MSFLYIDSKGDWSGSSKNKSPLCLFPKTLNLDGYSKINIPNKTLYLRQHNFCYFIPPFVGSAVRIIAEEILLVALI
jgi:hypothetical protein